MRISDLSSDVFSSDLFDPSRSQIIPKAISRIICDRDGSNPADIEVRIEKIVCDIEDEIKSDTVLRFAQEIQEKDKKLGIFKAKEFAEGVVNRRRSEEHTSELQSLMRNSYAVFCLKKKTNNITHKRHRQQK